MCIYSHRYADTILFHHEGGVDIGDVDNKVRQPSSRSYLQFGAEQLAVKTQLPIFTVQYTNKTRRTKMKRYLTATIITWCWGTTDEWI